MYLLVCFCEDITLTDEMSQSQKEFACMYFFYWDIKIDNDVPSNFAMIFLKYYWSSKIIALK